MKLLFAIILSQIISISAQLSLKVGMQKISGRVLSPMQPLKIVRSPYFWLGGCLYVAGTLVWLRVLTVADLSFAYPFAALAYAGGVFASQQLLREKVTVARWSGVALILIGLILIAAGAPSTISR